MNVCCCLSVGVAFQGGACLLGHVEVTWPEVGVSRSRVTFNPILVLQWAWHEVKGDAMAANEAEWNRVDSWARGKAIKA